MGKATLGVASTPVPTPAGPMMWQPFGALAEAHTTATQFGISEMWALTAEHNTAGHGAFQHGTPQQSTPRHGKEPHRKAKYSTAQHTTA